MLITELKKIFSKRFVQVFIVIILLGNGILGYINENVNIKATEVNARAYKMFQSDLEHLSEDEKITYLSDGLEYMQIMMSVQRYLNFGYTQADEESFSRLYPDYSLEECMKVFESGTYLRYTSNIFSERELYQEIQKEMELCNGYSSYVQNTLEKTLSMLKKLKNPSTYTYRNLSKMYVAFEGMQEVETSYGPSKGISFICNGVTTDLWALLFIFIIAILLITVEREKKLLILAKSTKNGRSKLAVSKLLVMYMMCILVMVLHIENYILADHIYGIGDLNRSIQSVAGYQGCTLAVSVGEFILLCFGMKLLVYFMFASLIYLVCTFFMSSIWVYLVTIGVSIVSILLYFMIPSNSSIIWLKEMTFVRFLDVNEVLGTYQNIRFGEYATNRLVLLITLSCCICLIGSVVGIVIFAIKNEKQSRTEKILFSSLKPISQWMEIHTNCLCHEIYKVFIVQHGVWILLLSSIFFIKVYEPSVALTSSMDEIYYQTFISDVIGPSENLATDYWEKLKLQYIDYYENANEEQDVQKMQNAQNALKAIERLMVHEKYLETKPGSWYVYDVGYGILTDSQSVYEISECMSVVYIILIGTICFVGMYSMDYQNNGIRILRTAKHGRGKLLANKMIIGSFIAIILFVVAWSPQLVDTLRTYGTKGMEAPAYSMEHLAWVPQWMSIKEYLGFMYLIRFVGILLLMLLLFSITICFKSFIVSICVGLGVTLLPLGLNIMNVEFMKYIFLTPILLGNPLLINGDIKTLLLCILQIFIILGISIRTIK